MKHAIVIPFLYTCILTTFFATYPNTVKSIKITRETRYGANIEGYAIECMPDERHELGYTVLGFRNGDGFWYQYPDCNPEEKIQVPKGTSIEEFSRRHCGE